MGQICIKLRENCAFRLFKNTNTFPWIRREPITSPSTLRRSQLEILWLLKEATSFTHGPPNSRLRASLSWVAAAGKWSDPSEIEAYRISLGLIQTILADNSSLQLRHTRLTSRQLARSQTLAVDAAACAISNDRPELAVELLEQGRAVLLTQAGHYRTRVDELEAIDSNLAGEFRKASREMEAFVLSARPQLDHDVMGPSSIRGGDKVARYPIH